MFFYVSLRLNVAGKIQGVIMMVMAIVAVLVVRVIDQVQLDFLLKPLIL